MEKSTNLAEISEKKESRIPDVFILPDEWRDESFDLDPTRSYGVKEVVEVSGISTFGAREMVIKVLEQEGNIPAFGLQGEMRMAIPTNLRSGKNNIHVGKIKITEHILAAVPSLGLRADFDLSESSFPSFDQGIFTLLEAIRPHLVDQGESKFVTVKEPFMVNFGSGYFIIEPDEGEHKLIVDHQFSHSKNVLGNQRAIVEISPEVFAYIASARTIAYGIRTRIGKFIKGLGGERLPLLNLGFENVVFVDKNEIVNPNLKFEAGETNWEPLMHEIIDKLAIFGLVPGRFVGRVTTFRTNHARDLDVAKVLLEKIKT